MKKILLSLTFAALYSLTHGQESATDSVPVHSLDEITVVAANQRATAVKTVYIPDYRQRSSSADGLALLARMNIPQLDVNPLTESVRTADNQSVSLFINYRTASKEDIAGLNPCDVLRVECFDFPVDPRFLRAEHVVNFVTKSVPYGGYTKLSAKERFLVNSGKGAVYSKFSQSAMEYDAMFEGEYDNNSHNGTQFNERYKFPEYTVERSGATSGGKHRQHSYFGALRALWKRSDSLTWRNLLSFRLDRVPVDETTGSLSLSGGSEEDRYTYSSEESSGRFVWESDVYAAWKGGWSLTGNAQLEYYNNRTESLYGAGITSISNAAHERTWYLRANVQANKSVSEACIVFANLITGGGHTVIDYGGSSEARNSFRPLFGGISAGLSLSKNKLSGSMDVGFAMESSTINLRTIDDFYPFTHINLRFVPDARNSLGLWFQYAAFSADASMKNPNIIRQNEILYVAGNPELHSSKHITANVSYTFLPGNMWQLSTYATMFRIMDRQIPIYIPDTETREMLKKYFNDGSYNHGQIGVRLSGKFFGGKLSAALAPRLLLYGTSGVYAITHYPFCASVNLDYYLGPLFFNVFWDSSSSYVDGETCYLRKLPSEYSFSAGLAKNGWNIQLSLVNIFRSSWKISDDILRSGGFDSTLTQYGASAHRRISLSFSYTINYGRKVEASDELRNDGSSSSSILK